MKLSIFLTVSNPIERQDPFYEAMSNYFDFADEVIVVNGNESDCKIIEKNKPILNYRNDDGGLAGKEIWYPWPQDFSWDFIGQQFQRGYDACMGDWVIRADCDYFFHENDFEEIRQFLENCDAPVATMPKRQFLLADRSRVKSRVPIAFNKGKYGNRIKLDSGGDLCQPSLDGKELKPDDLPEISKRELVMISEGVTQKQLDARLPGAKRGESHTFIQVRGIPFWNYECLLRTKEVEAREFHRFAKAWKKTFGTDPMGADSEEEALKKFLEMQLGRFNSNPGQMTHLDDHPKVMQETIKNLKPENFGYSLWGNVEKAIYFGGKNEEL